MWNFEYCPRPPEYRVDWEKLRGAFAWIRDMRGVEQEPQWHAEGDVETHVRMVAEAMAADPAWRAMDVRRREVLFVSALLHDVAKPACTKRVEGRWTSPRHAKVGEGMAGLLLWQGEAGEVPPLATRLELVKLVRYHGLPLRFIDKPEPERACVEARLEVNLADVAMLAEADVRGRQCADKQRLLDAVAMFREYCGELGCLDGPAAFESDHHRFMYCAAGKPRAYVPYDQARCTVTLMSGLPGSGKSTWARRHAGDFPIIALDDVRGDLDVDPADDQGPVLNEARDRAKQLLRAGQGFVWDATNVTRDLRAILVALFVNYGARVRIVYVEAPWREMLERNRARQRVVPEDVIRRLGRKLEIPTRTEAHAVVHVA